MAKSGRPRNALSSRLAAGFDFPPHPEIFLPLPCISKDEMNRVLRCFHELLIYTYRAFYAESVFALALPVYNNATFAPLNGNSEKLTDVCLTVKFNAG